MRVLVIFFLMLGSLVSAEHGVETFYKLDPKTHEYQESGSGDPDPKRPKLLGWYVDAKYTNPDAALVKAFMDVFVKDMVTPFGPACFKPLFAISFDVEGRTDVFLVSPECRKVKIYRGGELTWNRSISEEAAEGFLKFYQRLTEGK